MNKNDMNMDLEYINKAMNKALNNNDMELYTISLEDEEMIQNYL